MPEITQILKDRSFSGRKMKAIKSFDAAEYHGLPKIGIHLGMNSAHAEQNIRAMMRRQKRTSSYAMDNLQPPVTTPSATTPVQFLQFWLPGYVHAITNARRSDEIMGMQIMGNWADEQVVQGMLEELGLAIPYSDYQNTNLAEDNENFIYRTVVRMSIGIRVGMLEAARKARAGIDVYSVKRGSAALQLEVQRNQIAFYGFNGGNNFTYGFFNDPGLPSYFPVPSNAANTSTQWADKSLLEIENDIRTAVSQLRTASGDQVDPERTNLTLALPTSVVDYLSTASDFNVAVRDWLTKSYPRIRIVSAPELEAANGEENVGYLFADDVSDASTDGGQTWLQPVQTKMLVLGVAKYENYETEAYLNATAGAMLKRPYAVNRFTGI